MSDKTIAEQRTLKKAWVLEYRHKGSSETWRDWGGIYHSRQHILEELKRLNTYSIACEYRAVKYPRASMENANVG